MMPPELGLLLMSIRFGRGYIVLCRVAGLYGMGTSPCIASTFIGREMVG